MVLAIHLSMVLAMHYCPGALPSLKWENGNVYLYQHLFGVVMNFLVLTGTLVQIYVPTSLHTHCILCTNPPQIIKKVNTLTKCGSNDRIKNNSQGGIWHGIVYCNVM